MTACTVERADYPQKQNLIRDFPAILNAHSGIDHIVLSGRGEPALCSGISSLVDNLKKVSEIPVAIMSCGTLLWRPDVRKELARADVVTASIDAADKTVFHRINRPHALVPYARFIQGLWDFSKSYKGELFVLVHLLDGETAIEAEAVKIASLVKQIKPKKVFLTTARQTRLNKSVFPVEHARVQHFAGLFGGNATVVVLETQNEEKEIRKDRNRFGGPRKTEEEKAI
jgi:wyosine [tRNA(Phe)-imidazoG37] synthetase (radical SAM superfamily)